MSIYGISALASYPEAMPIFYIHSVVQTRGIFGADRPLIYGLTDLDTHSLTHSLMAKEKKRITLPQLFRRHDCSEIRHQN